MEVKMNFAKEQTFDPSYVIVELRGSPVLVENLKTLISDYMKELTDFKEHY